MTAATSPVDRTHLHRNGTALLGMMMFMASWAMLFSALFFAYFLVRQKALQWPPEDLPTLPVMLPGLATALLALSSAALQRGLNRIRGGLTGAAMNVGGATILGAAFLICQVVLWQQLVGAGLVPASGTYASIFYTFTVFHALHVLIGVGALMVLTVSAARGRFKAESHIPLRLWTLYWHMVGVIWGLMFVTLFLL
ncbi:MAG: cytochrome c oxidase subunit 3 [Deltaproteobacteria bacterium]|nr:cytochrome c oxidase subunit 3 [Deltaproteobacteria bacterium]